MSLPPIAKLFLPTGHKPWQSVCHDGHWYLLLDVYRRHEGREVLDIWRVRALR